MSEDILQELKELFEQVAIDKWYPEVAQFTFRTKSFPLTIDQSRALLRKNRAVRGELPSSSEETDEIIRHISEKLQNFLQEHFTTSNGVRAFIKLSDRSPKDATNLERKVHDLYNQRISNKSIHEYSNRNLQAYVWAKCRSLGISSADEGIELMLHSERACSELESKVELLQPPVPVSIILREWVDFDPATEFRGFVCKDNLTGLSQMASMDVKLHYPQLEHLRDQITKGAKKFFEKIRDSLRCVTESGPSDKYVLDLFYDVPNDKWYIVEVNPFQTSSSGHLFRYWDAKDMDILERGPFELRLSKKTDKDALLDIPEEWRVIVEQHDQFDVEESEFFSSTEIKTEGDLRYLLHSAKNGDSFIIHGVKRIPVHKRILSTRSESMAELLRENNEISWAADVISSSLLQELLGFIYSDFGSSCSAGEPWDCEDWNSLMMAALEIDLPDIIEKLIDWREKQAGGSDSSKLYGNESNAKFPGWKSKNGNYPNDALSFSFEIEGNGMQILKYYRPETVSEERWLAMSYQSRMEHIQRNWAHLKRKIKSNAFYWMNENLTIEDSGFLWEVSYGGDSAGYTLDLKHLLEEYQHAIDSGLGIADRFMDSGIQMHVAFPFFEDDDREIRADVLALMIHLDDYAFLSHFPQYIYDDCNNLWCDSDISQLFAAQQQGLDAFENYISRNGMPNPAVKHKHIGLRGIDTYKVKNRFGFEFRRGFQTEELPAMMSYITELLSRIGKEENIPVRFCWSSLGLKRGANYTVRDLATWIQGNNRCCPGKKEHEILPNEQILSIIKPWVKALVKWEQHLVSSKNLLWGNEVKEHVESSKLVDHATKKIMRRLSFVLCSDWRSFPHSEKQVEQLQCLHEEQQYIVSKMKSLLGETARKEFLSQQNDAQQVKVDDVRCTELRDMISDFAGRLSRLY